jgi:ATP-dependent RNA helicase DeaD
MDAIEKVDVDEEQIAPFMEEINRHFEYIDKEIIIKKIVSMTFGRFLDYYANAPEIVRPDDKRAKKERGNSNRERGGRKKGAEEGYTRLFINLGKDDGFFPGEVMQFLNKHIPGGKQQVGHIDLFGKFSYIEVPEQDAKRVMNALNGVMYKRREVRCNGADDPKELAIAKRGDKKNPTATKSERSRRRERKEAYQPEWEPRKRKSDKLDWRTLIQGVPFKGKGKGGDMEDGWARRRPKKK